MPKLVSIIIPTYNRAHLLGETLDSILSQTYQEWECLVIDDASTDHTRELVECYQEKDARIFYQSRPQNRPKGANACRNFGFEISKGEYINWFDSDDIMHPQKLELEISSLSAGDEEFCVCKTQTFERDRKNILGLRFKEQYSADPLEDYLKMKIGWMTPSVLWKRKTLENFDQLFDEELKAAQEWEFHSRALAYGCRYIVVGETLDLIRKHSDSTTYDKDEAGREWHYFLARLKIYQNMSLKLDSCIKDYLESYLLDSFKRMISNRNSLAMKAYRRYLWPSERIGLDAKFNALLAIISFRIFNKGNLCLQKIKYKQLT